MHSRRHARTAVCLLTALCCGSCGPKSVVTPAAAPPAAAAPAAPAAAAAPATTQTPETPEAAPVPTARLSGRVLAEDTGEPVSRARVVVAPLVETAPAVAATPGAALTVAVPSAAPAETPPARVALTGTDGRFNITELPAGSYRVTVTKNGFVTREFGQQRTLQAGTPVALRAGEAIELAEVKLAPGGVIGGRVIDEDGQPAGGIRIEVLRLQMQEGQRTLAAVGADETDDHGDFRIPGLFAGDYYVSAFDPAFDDVGDARGRLEYGPTYYPGVNNVAEARRIMVGRGAEVTDLAFQLKIIRPSRVSGNVYSHDGRPLLSGAVIMTPYYSGKLTVGPATGAVLAADGAFIFPNVPPGRYFLRARGETAREETTLFASFVLEARGRDIPAIQMGLSPGAVISGQLAFDSKTTPPPQDFGRILVSSPMEDGTLFGGLPKDPIQRDGAFRLNGVQGGLRYLRVEGVPAPWTLRAVYYQGRDVTDTALDVDNEQHVSALRVVFTDKSTEIAGKVLGVRGDTLNSFLVLAFPTDTRLWRPQSRQIRLVTPSLDGRYALRGLPPGSYFIAPVSDLDEAEMYEAEILQRFVGAAIRVALKEGEHKMQNLTVAPAVPQLASRGPAGGRPF